MMLQKQIGPSGRIIDAAASSTAITDSDGRHILLRRLGILDKLRLFKAVGPTLSQNEPYLGIALLACSAIAIDDVPVPMPTNESQIEHLVQCLGDPGIAAIAAALVPLLDPAPAQVAADAGNSPGTPA